MTFEISQLLGQEDSKNGGSKWIDDFLPLTKALYALFLTRKKRKVKTNKRQWGIAKGLRLKCYDRRGAEKNEYAFGKAFPKALLFYSTFPSAKGKLYYALKINLREMWANNNVIVLTQLPL